MLNSENIPIKFISNCIKDCPFVFIVRPCDPGNGNIRVVMTEINEIEERQLDSGKSLLLKRGGLSFNVDPDFCLAYGDLDLSPNSNDINTINNADWFARFYVRQFIPSEYVYEKHCVVSDKRGGRYFDTSNVKTYLPFLYGCINKPKRVVIFKEFIDIIALQKAKAKAERDANNYQKHKDSYRKRAKEKAAAKRLNKLRMLTFKFD